MRACNPNPRPAGPEEVPAGPVMEEIQAGPVDAKETAGDREGNRTGCAAISPQGIAPAQGAAAHERDVEGGVGSGENADDLDQLPTPKSVSDVHSESLPRSVSDGEGTTPLIPLAPPPPPAGAVHGRNWWYPIWLRCILREGNSDHPLTTSTAVAPWCLPMPMEQPLDPEPQRRNQTWRSRGTRNAKPAPAGEAIAPGRSGRWRPAATDTVHHRHAWWWALATPTGYSLAAICLLGLFLWQLLVLKRQVPLILGVVSTYRSPLGPVTMAAEDRELFRELMRQRSTYDPGTTKVIDISEALRESDAKQWLEEVAQRVAEVRPGGPGGQTLIVYLLAIGAVDRDGHACLVPPRASLLDVGSVDAAWLRVDSLLAALASKRPPAQISSSCSMSPGRPMPRPSVSPTVLFRWL